MNSDDIKKGACLCHKCNNVFQQKEHTYIERLGQLAYESVCPFCGSTYFGLIDYPVDEEELIYKNDKFYGLSNKMKRYIAAYEDMQEYFDELFI